MISAPTNPVSINHVGTGVLDRPLPHQNHNSRIAVAAKYAAAEGKIMTVGSDYHHPGFEGISATRTKVLPKDESELISIIKNEDFIIEVGGRILL